MTNELNILESYLLENKIDEALRLILRINDRYIRNAKFLNLKGIACINIEEYEIAEEALSEAIKIDNTNGEIYYNLAYLKEINGEYTDAAIYYGYAQKYILNDEIKIALKNTYNNNKELKGIKEIIAQGLKKHFIILSSEKWTNGTDRANKLALNLTKLGQQVSFVNPIKNIDVEEITVEEMVSYTFNLMENCNEVKIFTPIESVGYGKHTNNYISVCQQLMEDKDEEIIFIVDDYKTIDVFENLEGNFKIIYDYKESSSICEKNEDEANLENVFVDMADIIITPNIALYLELVCKHNTENIFIIKDGIDKAGVGKVDIINDMKKIFDNIPQPRIAYFDHINSEWDVDLYYDIVNKHKDKSFILFTLEEKNILNRPDNLYVIYLENQQELRDYLKYLDVAILSLETRESDVKQHYIQKQYEYLVSYIPVVSVGNIYIDMNAPYTFVSDTKEELCEMIQNAVQIEIQTQVIDEFIVANSWIAQAANLCDTVGKKQFCMSINQQINIIKTNLVKQMQDGHNAVAMCLYGKVLSLWDLKASLEYIQKAYDRAPTRYVSLKYSEALYEKGDKDKALEILSCLKDKYTQKVTVRYEPLISILIPTRNSAEYVKALIQTCMNQEYDNYEIVISDNSTEDNNETNELINEFINNNNSLRGKIKYVRTNGNLRMGYNYQNAYNNASGEYFILLGSDDGLLFHSLKYLAEIINKYPEEELIHWQPVGYGYKNIPFKHYEDRVIIPKVDFKNEVQCEHRNCKELLEDVINFRQRYSVLPMFYNSSLIKKSIVEELIEKTGRVFAFGAPDVYTGLAFARLRKRSLYVKFPLSIAGDSPKGMGARNKYSDGKYVKNENFHKRNKDRQVDGVNGLQGQDLIEDGLSKKYLSDIAIEENAVIWATYVLRKSNILSEEILKKINWRNYYSIWARNVYAYDTKEVFQEKLNNIYAKIREHNDLELEKWFCKRYLKNDNFKGSICLKQKESTRGIDENGTLIIKASEFSIQDVYEVANLFRKIYGI